MNNSESFFALNPTSNEFLPGAFKNASTEEINTVVELAARAFDVYRKKDTNTIADFLEEAANEILNLGDALLDRCQLETALPLARLQGERGRTVNQLKMFADIVREGSWVDARIDKAIPDRAPLPKSDLRHMFIPLGPVAVFGASNFPLAFSVAGGDTASALASGCPVVVKAHPAHPGTSQMVADAICNAAKKCNMPEGTFSLVHGNTNHVGESLVKHPLIKAVGFTGSFNGGKALFNLANARPEPIPVYAEMGSSNPVFILPNALSERAEEIAAGMAGSITMGVGQFCTNPGLTFVQKADAADKFGSTLSEKIKETPAGTMLTPGIKNAYQQGLENTKTLSNVSELASGIDAKDANSVSAKVFSTSMDNFINNQVLAHENFGPSNVLVTADTKEQIIAAAKNLEGHLTATVHGTEKDFEDYKDLFDILEKKVGRIVINGFPTGVEVCNAMVHGGPYPATTASQTTSVGTNAIKRFARPVCYQDFPEGLLPDALKNDNPLGVWRLIDGEFTKSKI